MEVNQIVLVPSHALTFVDNFFENIEPGGALSLAF